MSDVTEEKNLVSELDATSIIVGGKVIASENATSIIAGGKVIAREKQPVDRSAYHPLLEVQRRANETQTRLDKRVLKKLNQRGTILTGVSAFYLLYQLGLYKHGRVNELVLGIYITATLFNFYLVYIEAKRARLMKVATSSKWTFLEAAIIFMSCLGGWPGTYIAHFITSYCNDKKMYHYACYGATLANMYLFRIMSLQLSRSDTERSTWL